ncbi:cation diffusion facilitator family transporter [Parashewanella curva]|uniref:Cation-efflux pump FieF n=1 Tax=Parashewanella curva TaxID=2338552 RepID=A0A3L8PUA6_9GAMM|nr:cation diffusion facilitator family transporter [Parashewanella curva]RLV58991.1 cation diffusion facilitator family transporter [Parashewanella curva]
MAHQTDYVFWVKLASRASVLVAITLIVAKLFAWLYSGSASMLASLADSTSDLAASLVNFFALRIAITPADDDHRFGHGKAESLAALAQSAFITGTALVLIFYGGERLLEQAPVERTNLGIGVSAFAIVLTFGLVLLQRIAHAKTQSRVIAADALHYKSDLLLNLSVLIALVLSQYGWWWSDGLFAILIALYLGWQSLQLGKEAINELMDKELSPEVQQQIYDITMAHPQTQGAHDIRTRQSGRMVFVQLHLDLDADLSLYQAHDIADTIEHKIEQLFDHAEVIIHQDPVNTDGSHR